MRMNFPALQQISSRFHSQVKAFFLARYVEEHEEGVVDTHWLAKEKQKRGDTHTGGSNRTLTQLLCLLMKNLA